MSGRSSPFRRYLAFSRPFTLVMPALGMLTGAVMALGALPGAAAAIDDTSLLGPVWLRVLVGMLMASVLNAASNGLNQIHDLRIDRINRPRRMLPRGHLSLAAARRFTAAAYVAAMGLALLVGWACATITAVAAVLTWAYSAPPFRLKRVFVVSNLTIAASRGWLLPVAGWSICGPITVGEPWFVGFVFAVYVFGATTIKDFADVEGDRREGCHTLPVRLGARRAARVAAPFLFAPSVLLPLGLAAGWLSGNPVLLGVLAALLLPCAAGLVYALRERTEGFWRRGDHTAWAFAYLTSFALQIGLTLAYVLGI